MKDLVRDTWNALSRRCDDERGVALIVAAGSMVALTSAVALAIDVGMLTVARTEAQSAADGAAMAGASGLIESPELSEWARVLAIDYAGRNRIRGDAANVLPEDVDVDMSERTVTVRVHRTADRGNPLGTFFARIFGVTSVNISTDATARASYAGGVTCLLPLVIPDRWREAGGPGNNPDSFDPDKGDEYIPWADTSTDPPTYNDDFTGYHDGDIGDQIVLKSNSGPGDYNESWYYAWRPDGQQGADDYEENIRACVDTDQVYGIGKEVGTEPGDMVGPTNRGFNDLYSQDPNAVWNDNMDCVTDAAYEYSNDAHHCRSSPRIRPIPMFDPRYGPANGYDQFRFTNFAGVFYEGRDGNQLKARWIGYRGVNPVTVDGPSAGPQFKVIQLIE